MADLASLDSQISSLKSRIETYEFAQSQGFDRSAEINEAQAELDRLEAERADKAAWERTEQERLQSMRNEARQAAQKAERRQSAAEGALSLAGPEGAAVGEGIGLLNRLPSGARKGLQYLSPGMYLTMHPKIAAEKKEQEADEEEQKARKRAEKADRKRSSNSMAGSANGSAIAQVGRGVAGAAQTTYRAATSPWPWFLIALAIHVVDVIFDFRRSGTSFYVMLVIYTFWTFAVCLIYFQTGFTNDIFKWAGLSVLCLLLPLVLYVPYVRELTLMKFVFVFTPIWAMTIAFQQTESRLLRFLGAAPILFLIVVFLILFLWKIELPDVGGPGAQVGRALSDVWTNVKDGWARISDSFRNAGFFRWSKWQQRYNETLDPSALFFVGQVEDNKEEPHGVYITRLETLYPETPIGTDPVLYGRLEAKTFLPATVLIQPSCRLERPGKQNLEGRSDPSGTIPVNYKLIQDIVCNFDLRGVNVTKGTYYGVLGAEFPFETWAYVTNTFVARTTLEQYYQQEKDINRELHIDSQTEAIYTNGPVMVGVSADQQPIIIDPGATARPIGQRFGFTVQNRWSQGKIEKGTVTATVLVPKPFTLQNCSPSFARVTSDETWHNYSFTRSDDFKMDERLDASTVTCALGLPDRASAEQLLSKGEKVVTTFVVIARYTYTIEKKTPVKFIE